MSKRGGGREIERISQQHVNQTNEEEEVEEDEVVEERWRMRVRRLRRRWRRGTDSQTVAVCESNKSQACRKKRGSRRKEEDEEEFRKGKQEGRGGIAIV